MGCAPESLVPHDHDQASERVEIVGHLLADPDVEEERVHRFEQPAAPQIEQVGRVGVSGKGEGPTRVRTREAHGESVSERLPAAQ